MTCVFGKEKMERTKATVNVGNGEQNADVSRAICMVALSRTLDIIRKM